MRIKHRQAARARIVQFVVRAPSLSSHEAPGTKTAADVLGAKTAADALGVNTRGFGAPTRPLPPPPLVLGTRPA